MRTALESQSDLASELDPVVSALRWRRVICRRKYIVRYPNALWHIDGNHKMIGWRFEATLPLMVILN